MNKSSSFGFALYATGAVFTYGVLLGLARHKEIPATVWVVAPFVWPMILGAMFGNWYATSVGLGVDS